MLTAYRIDVMDQEENDLLPPVEGPGGSLLVEGIVARPGIYEYRLPDGGVRRELVPRAALWRQDSIETLARCVVTVEHPPEMVTDHNVRAYNHGDVGDEVIEAKKGYVKIRMALRSAEAKDAANAGKRQLSPGYKAVLDETPGVDDEFGTYDAIQTRRIYNHVAMCDRGRGGKDMAFRTDSADALVGTYVTRTPPMLNATLAAQFLARYDAAKELVEATLTDSLVGDFDRAKAMRTFWDNFWAVNEVIRTAIDKAFQEESPEKVQAALNAVSADMPALLSRLSEMFKDTLSITAERLDAPSPPGKPAPVVSSKKPAASPKEGEQTPPAGEEEPQLDAEGNPIPKEGEQTPPAGEEEPQLDAEGNPIQKPAPVPLPGGDEESQVDAEGNPIPKPPTAPSGEPKRTIVPPTGVPPAPESTITAAQFSAAFEAFEGRLLETLAKVLPVQPVELPGRTDSLPDGPEHKMMRDRIDSVAKDLEISYEGIKTGDLAREIVKKVRPEVTFRSDADYIAAAQVITVPNTTISPRRDSAPVTTAIPTIYGPQAS